MARSRATRLLRWCRTGRVQRDTMETEFELFLHELRWCRTDRMRSDLAWFRV
ncbi:hypothetical protein KNE206_63560 [Kitasatospora sp. NE20-6]